MLKSFIRLYKNKSYIYKIFFFLFSVFCIISLFPKKYNFEYEFFKVKFWNFKNLYTPFNFLLFRLENHINENKQKIRENKNYYLEKYKIISSQVLKNLDEKMILYNSVFFKKERIQIIDNTYNKDYIIANIFPYYFKIKDIICIISDINIKDFLHGITFNLKNEQVLTNKSISENSLQTPFFIKTLNDIIRLNILFNKDLFKKILDIKTFYISKNREIVSKIDKVIVIKNLINKDNSQKSSSLKKTYSEQIWTGKNYYLIIGYLLLISIVLCIFFSYLYFLRKDVYQNTNAIGFLVICIIFKYILSIVILRQDPELVYLIPFCLLPIMIRAFFDLNISFVTHLTTIILLAPIMPQSFDFAFLQITAGTFGLLGRSNIYKRINLFITSIKVTLIYIVSFFGLSLIHYETLNIVFPKKIFIFFMSGMLILLSQPLIFLFERLFGLTSNLSLLELSDTNSILLRLLSRKAPGTFQHSLTVANLAEEAAREIEADPLLVRIGALYHDIGKMENSNFFIENQRNIVDPHEELSPEESAKIILKHVSLGIEIAKKYKLPDRVIDFIRTHHGDTLVYFFYKKYKEKYPNKNIDISHFRYNGPRPFSKETAILMICDSIEAASKSLKNPSEKKLENLIKEIVDKQMKENQFSNAEITLREVEQTKSTLKKKLISIYHTRIEYPE